MAASFCLSHDLRAKEIACQLARLATDCLLDEARLTPKPGLVDRRGSGAHHDLSLALMERSAYSLASTFEAIALQSWQHSIDIVLRQRIGRLGREGELQMMQATGGVNTHRGAIWALGLLISALSTLGASGNVQKVTDTAARIALLHDSRAPKAFSNGIRVRHRYHLPGAREEAQSGFPHITNIALPNLYKSRWAGCSETEAQLNALIAIMASLSDTCVLSRAGPKGLKIMQEGAQVVLDNGGIATRAGYLAFTRLEQHMLLLNISPGGAADLLSATLFLDRVTTQLKR